MKKFFKFIKTFLFVFIWLIICLYLERFWRILHWKYILLNTRFVFDQMFWFTLRKFLFNFDIGFYLEEIFKYASYELPKEVFKYLPIFFVLRNIWIKKR